MIVDGALDLAKDFEKLTKTEAAKLFRKETRAGAKEIQSEILAKTPVKTGWEKKHIKIKAIKRSRKWMGHQVITEQDENKWYTPFSQLGHKDRSGKKVEGNNSMRDGFDAKGPSVADTIIANYGKAVETALKK